MRGKAKTETARQFFQIGKRYQFTAAGDGRIFTFVRSGSAENCQILVDGGTLEVHNWYDLTDQLNAGEIVAFPFDVGSIVFLAGEKKSGGVRPRYRVTGIEFDPGWQKLGAWLQQIKADGSDRTDKQPRLTTLGFLVDATKPEPAPARSDNGPQGLRELLRIG
jgi:hypothetical protein